MCGAGLGPEASVGHSARQVFDLPKPQPLIVTEHRAHDCQCAACGAKTRAPFPDGVNAPVQYGVGIAAFVVYLLHYQKSSLLRATIGLQQTLKGAIKLESLPKTWKSCSRTTLCFHGKPRART